MTMNNGSPDPLAVTLGPVVLSYPNLFVPRENKNDSGSKLEYDAEFLLYNEGPNAALFQESIQKLQTAVWAAAQECFGQQAQAVLQTTRNPWFQDLSAKKALGKWDGPLGIGIRAKSPRKPEVVKRDPNSPPNKPVLIPVTDPEEVYAGMIVVAGIRAKPYKHPSGNQGVSWWLNHVLIVGDGEPLAESRVSATEVFNADVLNRIANIPMPQSASQAMMQAGGAMFNPGAPPNMMPGGYGVPPMAPATQMQVDNVMGFNAAPQPPVNMPPGFAAPQAGPMTGVPGMMPNGMPQGYPQMQTPPTGQPGYASTPQMPGGMPGVRY